jgi:hypothetical protein
MHRRSFLGGILALGAAPAIVRASSLMKVATLKETLTYGNQLLSIDTITKEALVISLDDFSDRIIRPSVIAVANRIRNDVLQIRKPLRFEPYA